MKENSREMTIEELEKLYAEAEEKYKDLSKQLSQKKQEEENRKKAQLTAEKDTRYKEIEEVCEHLCQLIKDWTKDYGTFSFKRDYKDGYGFPYLYHLFF